MNISTWLKDATKQLKDIGIESNRLDAELILAETIRKPRTWMHAHLDEELDPRRVDIANARLELRKSRVPLAYIIGHKEFYGRHFTVSPSVLVPRPESEDMISLFLELTGGDIQHKTLIDVGTGSGCLGITAKLERPHTEVILSDISPEALRVAEKNAAALEATVRLQEQNLLAGQIEPVDYVFANLPYVDDSWPTSPETKHEPQLALFADNHGLSLILRLIEQAPRSMTAEAWLFIEADPVQHDAIIAHGESHGFKHHETHHYCLALRRVAAES